jgi:hypothetical protein
MAVKSLYFGKFYQWHSLDERTFYKVTVDYKIIYKLQLMYIMDGYKCCSSPICLSFNIKLTGKNISSFMKKKVNTSV